MKNRTVLLLIGCTLLLNAAPRASETAAPGTLSNVLYGAAYYHEYEPYERLNKTSS